MRVLIVASSPGARCGISRYAAQEASRLRESGHEVDWASCDGGTDGVRWPLSLDRPRGLVRLVRVAVGYDRVILHYQRDLFFRSRRKADVVARNLVLSCLFARARGTVVVMHEVESSCLRRGFSPRRLSERLKWRLAPRLVFHTAHEREAFLAQLPGAEPRTELREHHAVLQLARAVGREQARDELGVPASAAVFLCIGFIQESKGFDRAMRAFSRVPGAGARLYVVGSARTESTAERRCLDELRTLAAADGRIALREGFVSDATFDTWIAAADVVVLPYRSIWSSGVAARARLQARRLVVADVGGLADQTGPGDHVIHDDDELGAALAACLAEIGP